MSKTNVREGLRLERTADGLTGTQTIDLDGLTGEGLALLYKALTHGSVPREGQQATGVPGLTVSGHSVRPNGTAGARVTVRYGGAGAGGLGADAELGETTVRVATEVIAEETIRDIDGDLMFTRYVSAFAAGLSGSSVSVTTQYHRVSVERPTFAVVFSRVERTNAFATATTYAGKVNARPWQGKPEKSWLMRVDSQQLAEDRHQVSYSAVYNPATWRAEIRHSSGGIVPAQIRENNGLEYRDVYESLDFHRLKLPSIL